LGWLNQDEPFAKLGMAKTKQTLFVIVAGTQQQGAPGTYSIAQDSSTTMIRLKAARFYSFADAKEFAKEKHITFNALTYIGLEDFTDLEMQGSEPFDN
jgi:hypothetical protein